MHLNTCGLQHIIHNIKIQFRNSRYRFCDVSASDLRKKSAKGLLAVHTCIADTDTISYSLSMVKCLNYHHSRHRFHHEFYPHHHHHQQHQDRHHHYRHRRKKDRCISATYFMQSFWPYIGQCPATYKRPENPNPLSLFSNISDFISLLV